MLMLPCLTVFANAAGSELPFDLVAPANVTAQWQEGGDSPTTTVVSYSLSNAMTDFFKKKENASVGGTLEEFMSSYSFDDIWMDIQVDWALDDVNDSVSGWHYNEYWEGKSGYGFGKDNEGNPRYSDWDVVQAGLNNATETVNDIWVTRGVPNDDRLNGNPETHTPGVKDQLKPDQFSYDYDEEKLVIDFKEHTMFFRVRFIVTVQKDGSDDKYYFSEWSNVASTGKDAEKSKPLTKDDLTAPVITGLRLTDEEFNDNPVVAFTLTVPDKLAADATKVFADGGHITVEIQGRVKGDKEFTNLQGDWEVKGGEMTANLFNLANEERPNVPKDSIIELRCRYRYDHPKYFDDAIYSDWSKIISFGTNDINYGNTPAKDGQVDDDGQAKQDKKTCPICHFCPQPLGICIFIWLLIILVVIIIIVIITAIAKKSKKKDKEEKK